MRLSCNFVNVYTIVYRVSVHERVYTRASPTDILARKSARRTKVSRQVVRECPARGELNGPRASRPAASAEVGEEVRIGVGVRVRVGPVEFKH